MHEIALPETKPALEWVNGRVLQKMSPRREHALAQGRFFTAPDAFRDSSVCAGRLRERSGQPFHKVDEVELEMVPFEHGGNSESGAGQGFG